MDKESEREGEKPGQRERWIDRLRGRDKERDGGTWIDRERQEERHQGTDVRRERETDTYTYR